MLLVSGREATLIGQPNHIAGTMKHAHDDQLVVTGQVIDRIMTMKDYP